MAALISLSLSFLYRLGLYLQLTKPRLSVVVVFSAIMGAVIGGLNEWQTLVWLALGGYAITGSANAANQVWERETDALMERTRERPLPAGLLPWREGLLVSLFLLGIGIGMLAMLRWDVALLGGIAWMLYVLAYTPLKKVGVVAVFVGALPGALPPVIGYWAVHPEVTHLLVALFILQLAWQFPHFWVIAWLSQRDYGRAGFHLLPFPASQARANRLALFLSIWALPVLAVGLWPWLPWQVGLWAFLLGIGIGAYSLWWSRSQTTKGLRYLLLGLTAYLTLLYVGTSWLL